MRQVIAKILFLLLVTQLSFAQTITGQPPLVSPSLVLDKIDFQLSAKEWVTTQTALLDININVTLNSADLVKARADIMERLNKIAKGEWHIIQFNRSQDSSGLEKLYAQAQARINQEYLINIYLNAKDVSLPGAKYEVSSIDFKPSFEEIQAVLGQIRQKLYQQVNEELARINKTYPGQNYSISNLVFSQNMNSEQPRALQMKTMMAGEAMTPAPVLSLSNELILTVEVEVASNRKQ